MKFILMSVLATITIGLFGCGGQSNESSATSDNSKSYTCYSENRNIGRLYYATDSDRTQAVTKALQKCSNDKLAIVLEYHCIAPICD